VSDTRLLREVLATTYGRALDLRLLLIALVVLVLTYRHHLPVRWLGVCAGALLTGCGVTFALCGHAAAGGHREWAVASDTLHVVAMSVWLGGLAMLLAVVLAGGPQCGAQRPGAMQAVFRFSTLATGALTVMVATGTFQALREVRSWDVLLHTHYGHVLLVKLGVVGLALLAAAGSRTWVWRTAHPVVAVHASTGAPPEPAIDSAPSLRRLRTSVGLETLLLTGVLVVSALLVTSDPAASSPQAATSLTWSGQARPTT
jgi:copper transport protein